MMIMITFVIMDITVQRIYLKFKKSKSSRYIIRFAKVTNSSIKQQSLHSTAHDVEQSLLYLL